ncbi:MAG: undecaprenyldiphospho-muramoylpentapeptide beta-N-acetylglucosaminyltransferase [Polyangia bacterium]|jgi:UDP-N-acetylglucosamine--N-acetylmuramyl-(pentapeptide) pyrophosphoryl-undecaprenol N-acetylglucosamine transferase|nr:undecaprenyldiphospho-muramoylpentapeptide beta-N-acetylglucosaminyltransferase [Polyangia bacterium]
MTSLRVLIAGGGTGGHLFPGIAVAEEIRARGGEVSFVGTARGIEAKILPRLELPLDLIQMHGLVRTGWKERLRFLWDAPASLVQVARILRRRRPHVVVGVGGYASGPVVMSSALGFLPTAVLEQNSIPGITNRILGRVVKRVFASFKESIRYFPRRKVELTGNPVRRQIVESLSRASGGQHGDRLRVLAFGGSQGARFINETLMAAAPKLARMPIELTHQTGEADHARVQEAYRAAGLEAEVLPFIDDMAARYSASDLILSRAGATTLAELAIVGRPAILVPFPFATHNHQELNAREVERAGAALCCPQPTLEGDRLVEILGELEADPDRRSRMAAAMRALGRPEAARQIVDGLEELANARRRS